MKKSFFSMLVVSALVGGSSVASAVYTHVDDSATDPGDQTIDIDNVGCFDIGFTDIDAAEKVVADAEEIIDDLTNASPNEVGFNGGRGNASIIKPDAPTDAGNVESVPAYGDFQKATTTSSEDSDTLSDNLVFTSSPYAIDRDTTNGSGDLSLIGDALPAFAPESSGISAMEGSSVDGITSGSTPDSAATPVTDTTGTFDNSGSRAPGDSTNAETGVSVNTGLFSLGIGFSPFRTPVALMDAADAGPLLTKLEGINDDCTSRGHMAFGEFSEAKSTGRADGAKVIVSASETGGTDRHDILVVGGGSVHANIDAVNNTLIMTGGEVAELSGGFAKNGADALNNRVYLVGSGASATIGDTTYVGGTIKVVANGVRAGYVDGGGKSSNNSVDIYGSDITVSSLDTAYTQILNFHIDEALVTGGTATMISLGSGLTFKTDTQLNFYSNTETDWSKFVGKSLNLVYAAKGITGIESVQVNIMSEDPIQQVRLATATLSLDTDNCSLVLSNFQPVVPEPTTGTLSLLALAALAARRRRK